MENNNSLVQELEKEEKQELDGVPVCGANLSIPVIGIAKYIFGSFLTGSGIPSS